MSKIGSVNVIWKNVDIHAFSGEVMDVARSSETHVSGNANVNGGQITSSTTHYAQLFIRNPVTGEEYDIEFAHPKVGFRAGHKATMLWGTTPGVTKKTWPYIGVYNHTTGQMQTIRKGNNDLACIPFYNWIMIVAVFVGVFNLIMGTGLLKWPLVLLSIGYIVFMYLCQKKLIDGTTELMKTYTPDFGAVPQAAAVTMPEITQAAAAAPAEASVAAPAMDQSLAK